MATPDIPKGDTGKFIRQGHTTSGLYGDDPKVEGVKGVPGEPTELKKQQLG